MKRAIITLMILATILLSVSCGNEDFVGYWESAYGEYEGELTEAARFLTVEVKEDGTAVFSYAKSDKLETTWIEKDGYYIIGPEHSQYKAWIENRVLVIDIDDLNLKLFLVRDLDNFQFPPNIKKGVRIE